MYNGGLERSFKDDGKIYTKAAKHNIKRMWPYLFQRIFSSKDLEDYFSIFKVIVFYKHDKYRRLLKRTIVCNGSICNLSHVKFFYSIFKIYVIFNYN